MTKAPDPDRDVENLKRQQERVAQEYEFGHVRWTEAEKNPDGSYKSGGVAAPQSKSCEHRHVGIVVPEPAPHIHRWGCVRCGNPKVCSKCMKCECGGVAAPLEPTPPSVAGMWQEWWIKRLEGRRQRIIQQTDVLDFAEAYAAAVSKKLREELADDCVKLNELDDDLDVARARITVLEQELRELKEKSGFRIAEEDEKGPYYVDTHCVRCGRTRLEHDNNHPEACGYFI